MRKNTSLLQVHNNPTQSRFRDEQYNTDENRQVNLCHLNRNNQNSKRSSADHRKNSLRQKSREFSEQDSDLKLNNYIQIISERVSRKILESQSRSKFIPVGSIKQISREKEREKKLQNRLTKMLIKQEQKTNIVKQSHYNKIRFGNLRSENQNDIESSFKNQLISQEYLLNSESESNRHKDIKNISFMEFGGHCHKNANNKLYRELQMQQPSKNKFSHNLSETFTHIPKIKQKSKGSQNKQNTFNSNLNTDSNYLMNSINQPQAQSQRYKQLTLEQYSMKQEKDAPNFQVLRDYINSTSSISQNQQPSFQQQISMKHNQYLSSIQGQSQTNKESEPRLKQIHKNNRQPCLQFQQPEFDLTAKKKNRKINQEQKQVLKQVRELKDILINALNLKQGNKIVRKNGKLIL